MMRACVRVEAGSDAEMLSTALRPEASDDLSRSGVKVIHESGMLIIDIESKDVIALRAALNSYLRWVKLAIDSKEAIGGIQ